MREIMITLRILGFFVGAFMMTQLLPPILAVPLIIIGGIINLRTPLF